MLEKQSVYVVSTTAQNVKLTWSVAAEPSHSQGGRDIATSEEDAESHIAADVLSHCNNDDQADQAGN